MAGYASYSSIMHLGKIQLVIYYQCCVLIGWATTRLYVIAHWWWKAPALKTKTMVVCYTAVFRVVTQCSSSLFCWRIWPFLLLPGRTCRTAWTILWTARLLSKSDHGMATLELMEVHNDDDVIDIINCVTLYYEKDTSGNAFLREEKFRAPISRQVKTLKVLKETVRWVDLSLLLSRLLVVRLFS